MDAQKIINENWNQHQRVYGAGIYGLVEALADSVDRIWCFIGWKRRKEDFFMTIWISGGNIVLCTFEATANTSLGVFVQIPVQLEDIGCTDGNVLIAFVDGIQHIPVAHDFFLIAVPGRGFLHAELLDSGIGGDDALNLVGGFGALHLRNIDQLIQYGRLLFQIQLLTTLIFMDLGYQTENLRIPLLGLKLGIVKGSHLPNLLCFSLIICVL